MLPGFILLAGLSCKRPIRVGRVRWNQRLARQKVHGRQEGEKAFQAGCEIVGERGKDTGVSQGVSAVAVTSAA